MSETLTEWMNAREFVKWLEDQRIYNPMAAWKLVEVLRQHSAREIVLETGHPINPGRAAGRPVICYTIRKQVVRDLMGGYVRFQATIEPLRKTTPDA